MSKRTNTNTNRKENSAHLPRSLQGLHIPTWNTYSSVFLTPNLKNLQNTASSSKWKNTNGDNRQTQTTSSKRSRGTVATQTTSSKRSRGTVANRRPNQTEQNYHKHLVSNPALLNWFSNGELKPEELKILEGLQPKNPSPNNSNHANMTRSPSNSVLSRCDVQDVLRFVWKIGGEPNNALRRKMVSIQQQGNVLSHLLHMYKDMDRHLAAEMYLYLTKEKRVDTPEKAWTIVANELGLTENQVQNYAKRTKISKFPVPSIRKDASCVVLDPQRSVRVDQEGVQWTDDRFLLLALGATIYGTEHDSISRYIFGGSIDTKSIRMKFQTVRRIKTASQQPLHLLIKCRGNAYNGYTPPFIRRFESLRTSRLPYRRELEGFFTKQRGKKSKSK